MASDEPIFGATQDRLAGAGPSRTQAANLRKELSVLKLGALQKKAAAEGADAEKITQALDADEPREALVGVILDMMGQELAAHAAVEAANAARENQLCDLRTELATLKLGALQRKAAEEGADADAMAEALDADDPKEALSNLLLDLMVPQVDAAALAARAEAEARRKEQLDAVRAELTMLKLGALQKKAIAEGAGADVVADALDADDPKQAVVNLLVQLIAPEVVDGDATATEAKAAAAAELQRVEQLTAELSALGLGALHQRAADEGLASSAIVGALDSDSPKSAIVKAIVAARSSVAGVRANAPECTASSAHTEQLRHELSTLQTSKLLQLARAAGVTQEELDQAADRDDPHSVLVGMIAALEAAGPDELDELRTELEHLKISQLLQRARAAGVAQTVLDEAADSDDHKGALVSLILETTMSPALSPPQAKKAAEADKKTAEDELRAELASLPMSQLLKHARAAGIDQETLDVAADSADQKRKLISLVLGATVDAQPSPAGSPPPVPTASQPHFRAKLPQEVSAAKAESFLVMLSYEWSSQPIVIQVCNALQARGVRCWMDIQGGMKRDIYDSMAEGVTGCTAIVPFMTPAYQSSENCTLELKFARQLGKPIVPVLMQDGWQATGWLGILTAGALWTPISDLAMIEENVDKLISQLALAAGNEPRQPQKEEQEEEEELSEIKHELQRFLKREQPAASLAAAAGDDPAEARLPAEVPEPPPFMMVTPDMDQAKAYLTRQLGGSCEVIVVIGMGGIGKTTYCSWLCHQPDVLGNFETVVWVTLGQEADLQRVLQLIYLQLEPQGLLPPALSMDLAKELVKQAMAEKRLLLVIDDGWSKSELQQLLALVDRKTGSKILVSSRLHGLCDESPITVTEVQAQLPSMADAVRLLLGAAGLTWDGNPPAEAEQIVRQCSHLPLALGMCGKILKGLSLGVDESWQGVLDIIQGVMNESEEQRTIEETVILASLKNLPTDAQLMFYSLGLCAEDATLPLEMLVIFFQATKQVLAPPAEPQRTDRPISIMYARRMVKQLLDRSLVLGKVDCVSLHDLVRDHAQSKMDEHQKLAAHKMIVQHFVLHRPNRVQGWMHAEHPLTKYVTTHAHCHIQKGWEGLGTTSDDSVRAVTWQSDTVAVHWLTAGSKGFIDPIIYAAGMVLGSKRCAELARRHTEAESFWEAAVCWGVVARTIWAAGKARSTEYYQALKSCVEACSRVLLPEPESTSSTSDHASARISPDREIPVAVARESVERLELHAVIKLFQSWDLSVQQPLLPNILRLAPTPVAREDPATRYLMIFMAEAIPHWFAGEPQGFGAAINKQYKLCTDVAFRDGEDWCADGRVMEMDKHTRDLIAVCSVGYPTCLSHWELLMEAEDYDWRLFGPNGDGEYLKRAESAYSFDSQHSSIAELCGFDIGYFPAPGWLMAVHWGELEYAKSSSMRVIHSIARGRREAGDGSLMAPDEAMCISMYHGTCWFLFCLDLRVAAATIVEGTPFDLAGVEAGPDDTDATRSGTTVTIRRFFTEHSMVMHNPAGFTNAYRLMHVLLADPDSLAKQERVVALLASIPESPRELAMMAIPAICPMPTLCYHSGLSITTLAAFVFAKLGQLVKAEAYADEALLGDITRGGDTLPSTKIFSLIVRGLAQTARGEAADADKSFSDAVGVAESTGELLYAVFGCFCWQRACDAAATTDGGGDVARAAMVAERWLAITSRMASPEAELRALCEVVWRPLEI